jgi:hypothetical protein
MTIQYDTSREDCCALLNDRYEFCLAKKIPGLGDRLQLLRTEGHGYTRIYGCTRCGTVWREESTPVGQGDKYVTTRMT